VHSSGARLAFAPAGFGFLTQNRVCWRKARNGGEGAPSFAANTYNETLETTLAHFAAKMIARAGVQVDPASFRLPAADLETIEHQESISTSKLNHLLEDFRRSATPIARRIESTIARLLRGDWGIAVPAGRTPPLSNLRVAWASFAALSQVQEEAIKIRRQSYAIGIVWENAGAFHAATSANLIHDLETSACAEIQRILTQTAGVGASVHLDHSEPMTLEAQLNLRTNSALSTHWSVSHSSLTPFRVAR